MLRHDFQDSTVFSVRPYQFFDSVAVRSVARYGTVDYILIFHLHIYLLGDSTCFSWTCVVGLLVAAGYTFMKLR